MEEVIAEEYMQVQTTLKQLRNLPPLQLPDEVSKPMGHGRLHYTQLDYKSLVDMRRNHQTKQAATGVRTRKADPDSTASIRGQIVQEFHRVLRAAQDTESAVGTGLERQVRWRTAAPGGAEGVVNGQKAKEPASGNSANAAAVAATAADQVSHLINVIVLLHCVYVSRLLFAVSACLRKQRCQMFWSSLTQKSRCFVLYNLRTTDLS